MLETITLGVIQGITEWLPISSEGALVLAKVNLFRSGLTISELIRFALFLHLGTFFAALVYFRKDVSLLIKGLFNYQKTDEPTKKLIRFYLLATLVSGLIGFMIFRVVRGFEDRFVLGSKGLTLIVGIMLLITAFLQFKKKKGLRGITDLNDEDSFILGFAQGFSILPGLSRSGLTISAFLLRKFDETQALKLSFLMSLPVVLAGNIVLNFDKFALSSEFFVGFMSSFLLGILTIHLLLKIAKKLNFGWFVLLFGLITIASSIFI